MVEGRRSRLQTPAARGRTKRGREREERARPPERRAPKWKRAGRQARTQQRHRAVRHRLAPALCLHLAIRVPQTLPTRLGAPPPAPTLPARQHRPHHARTGGVVSRPRFPSCTLPASVVTQAVRRHLTCSLSLSLSLSRFPSCKQNKTSERVLNEYRHHMRLRPCAPAPMHVPVFSCVCVQVSVRAVYRLHIGCI